MPKHKNKKITISNVVYTFLTKMLYKKSNIKTSNKEINIEKLKLA